MVEALFADCHPALTPVSLADSNYFMGLICEAEGEHEMAKDYFRMASISPFGIFNSITQEMADEKYEEYHGKSE